LQWIDLALEPCPLECVYCGQSSEFPHFKSYEYENETFSLYKCTHCKSLIYDLRDVDQPIVPQVDQPDGVISEDVRWIYEAGFSSYHVAACALSALPDVPDHELKEHVFVDVGAGLGMASYFIKTLFGLKIITVEPSRTGKLARDVLGLDVHRAYFEKLPQEILDELANKPCLLHLNSVVEHLVDPAAVLSDIMSRVQVEVLAAIVPDAAWINLNEPFLNAVSYLAPRDHRHLPTELGMELLLKRLGFSHVATAITPGLLTSIGSRSPVSVPSERLIKLGRACLSRKPETPPPSAGRRRRRFSAAGRGCHEPERAADGGARPLLRL